MINLFNLAGSATRAINPPIIAEVKLSTGHFIQADGTPTPIFTRVKVEIDVQALNPSDLQHVDGISQQKDTRIVYIRGALRALNRPLRCGGDFLVFSGSEWLVTQQLEEWGDGAWSKVLVTRQITPP